MCAQPPLPPQPQPQSQPLQPPLKNKAGHQLTKSGGTWFCCMPTGKGKNCIASSPCIDCASLLADWTRQFPRHAHSLHELHESGLRCQVCQCMAMPKYFGCRQTAIGHQHFVCCQAVECESCARKRGTAPPPAVPVPPPTGPAPPAPPAPQPDAPAAVAAFCWHHLGFSPPVRLPVLTKCYDPRCDKGGADKPVAACHACLKQYHSHPKPTAWLGGGKLPFAK